MKTSDGTLKSIAYSCRAAVDEERTDHSGKLGEEIAVSSPGCRLLERKESGKTLGKTNF